MEDIICLKCGSVNEFYTELKAHNNVARCNKCDNFIKNIPYAEPTLFFGKYKGRKVVDIQDTSYLKWCLSLKHTKTMREAIQKQIDRYEFLGK